MRKVLAVCLVLYLIGSLAGCAPAGPAAGGSIKIGVLEPLTGNVAYWGTNALNGVQLAADQINAAGGILGKKIELQIVDSAGDKAQSVNGIKKLTSQGVVAVIGPVTSGETFAVGPICNETKTLYISPGATAEGVGTIGAYVFRNTLNDSVGAPLMADYIIKQQKIQRPALLYSNNNDYGVGINKLWTAALAKAGIASIAEVTFSDGDTDFSAQITKLKSLNPDAIFYGGVAAEGGLILRKAREQGLNVPFISGDGLMDDQLFKLAGDSADGTIMYTGYSPENPADYAQKFVQDYKAKYNQEPQINSAQGYDAMQLVAQAITSAGTTTDREAIRKALTQVKGFKGVSGLTTFNDKNGNAAKPAFVVRVESQKYKLLTIINP